jgi:Recombinase
VRHAPATLSSASRLAVCSREARSIAQARKVAVEVVAANADRHAANVLPIIREIQKAGARSLRAIAEALNARGVPTARGRRWQAMTVSNVLARA